MKYKNESCFKPEECLFCKSKELVKWGYRYNHATKKQRYKCNSCGKLFVVDDGFFRCKKKRELIAYCLDLCKKGMSLRKVANHVSQFSEQKVSHTAIMKWLLRYSNL